MRYKRSILGGTFDRFHVGHQQLLMTAFAQSEKVIIGISKPNLYRKKVLVEQIEAYTIRVKHVKKFLQKNNFTNRATIIPITDIYGNTLTEKDLEAIFIAKDTIANVQLINKRRSKKGFPKLTTVLVPYVLGEDKKIVTSERIRLGEIDRTGYSYKKLLLNNTFILPKTLREELRKPIGKVLTDLSAILGIKRTLIIAVGDIVTLSLLKLDRQPDISIIDYRTRRQELNNEDLALLTSLPSPLYCPNPAGAIDNKAIISLIKMLDNYSDILKTNHPLQKKQAIIIQGEEDLLTLPAILLAPLGSVVLYGQFGQGAVVVVVTEEKKKKVNNIIKKFSIKKITTNNHLI